MQTETEVNARSRSARRSSVTGIVVVLAAMVLFASIRYRLRDMPLERDEGEYAYAGQLLLQGIPPYKLAYNMKLPGIYAAYAAIFAVFGETPSGIHLGLLVINGATALLLFFLVKRLFGTLAATTAACSFALFSASTSVMGFQAHATNFVAFPAVASILLLLRALDSHSGWLFFTSGLCAGLAFEMKQHGAFFALFGFLYLVLPGKHQKIIAGRLVRYAALFSAGVVLPYAIACWLLYRAGVFHTFWFWTVSYAAEYSKMGLRRGIRDFILNFSGVAAPAGYLWLLAVFGATTPFWNRKASRHAGFIFGFFGCSFVAICPGAYFRPHYFVLLLPAAALLVGLSVDALCDALGDGSRKAYRVIPILIFVAAFLHSVFQQRSEYFSMSANDVFQDVYDNNPFLAAAAVGEYLRKNSPPAAQIAVLGSEPEIYFYAHRHSSTGYLYMYSLMVRQKYTPRMRQEFLDELSHHHPDYVVYVDEWNSWGGLGTNPETTAFLSSLHDFMNRNYENVGVAELADPPAYLWGAAAANSRGRTGKAIYVMMRKAGS